ncbi:MAG: chalcone isomerase family protein [Thermoanaerobaculia bacterium]|nr:chalcone isomerase family protein [Thermoanaerobaculia bacterium]
MKRLLVLSLALLAATSALAGELKGVEVPDTIQMEGQPLVLNGMALRKVAIFKVYVAAFYLPVKQSDAEAILASDTLRHIEMHWQRGVSKEDVCKGWTDGLAANTPEAPAELVAQFGELCDLMVPAKDGQVLSFTYLPGTGTRVVIDGEAKGTIEGKAFADALWRCWIGPDPGPGERFKQDLLGA